MRTFVESLYRLYRAERITKEQLDKLLSDKRITKEEYDYIIGN